MKSKLVRAIVCSMVVAGCGDDGGSIIDAPMGDVGVDGEVGVDGSSGVVRLTVYDFGNPVVGVPVYFQNADSSLVMAAMTGSDGAAQAEMMPGGFVSAFVPPSSDVSAAHGGFFSRQVYTFAGVKPGDELVLGQAPRNSFVIDVEFPTEPNSTGFEITSTCGDNFVSTATPQPTGTIVAQLLIEDCPSGLADFAMTADGGKGGRRALVARNVAVVDGTAAMLTGTWGPLHHNAVTYSGLTDRIFEVGLEQWILTPRGRVAYQQNNGNPTGGTVTLEHDQAVGPGTGVVQANIARFFPNDGFSQSVVADWGAHAAATTILPTPTLLHAYTAFPELDVTNRRVAWSEAAAGATADFAVAYLSIARSSQKRSWNWSIVGPRAEANLPLPVLPTDLIDFNPIDGDFVNVDQLYTYDVPGGYDAVRAHVFRGDVHELITAPAGRIVREEIFFQPT